MQNNGSQVVDSTAIVVRSEPLPPAPVGLFGAAAGPAGIVRAATECANVLAQVVESQRLYTNIQGRKHVRVEGWTLLGNLLGVFPAVAWSRPLEHDGKVFGWECRAEARTKAGDLVGAAEAMCTKAEKTWASRDSFALRSMAQTRAISKALRLPLGFVMTLAGYEATPEEEMPGDLPREAPRTQERQAAPATRGHQQNGQAPDPRKKGLAAVNVMVAKLFEDRGSFYDWLASENLTPPVNEAKGKPSIDQLGTEDLRFLYGRLGDLERQQQAAREAQS